MAQHHLQLMIFLGLCPLFQLVISGCLKFFILSYSLFLDLYAWTSWLSDVNVLLLCFINLFLAACAIVFCIIKLFSAV